MQGVQGVQAVDLGLPGDLLFSPGDSPFLPGDLPFCELGDLPFCGPGDLPFCGPGDLPFCMPGDWPLCVVIRVEVEGLGSSSSSSSDLFPSVSNCSEMGGSFCVSYNLGQGFSTSGSRPHLGSPSDFRGVARLSTNFLKNDGIFKY